MNRITTGRTGTDHAGNERRTLGRAALVSLALGTATIGCTPSAHMDHVAALSDAPVRNGDAIAMRAAAKAKAALAAHKPAVAIRWAERAVAASPNDADDRLLLGQAYLAAGRFASAETAFRDTLTLAPDKAQASFDLGLVQIAQGLPDEGRVTLAAVKGKVPDADLGLATTIAGDHSAGIAMLTDVVRDGKSDARLRQNLALAFALDNQWDQARGMAMQDTPPDRLEAKLAGWRLMAKEGGAQQVATMLGTTPEAADPGRPQQLALATPGAAPAATALAAADPVPVVQAAPDAAPVQTAAVDAPVAASAPVEVADATPPMPIPLPAMPTPPVPALLAAAPASAPSEAGTPPRLVRVADARPVPVARPAAVSPGPILHPVENGGFVVQLGAYARSGALDTAWAQASRLSPRVATFTPVQGSTQHQGATLMRLSIGSFASRSEATGLCLQVKARGGACFVRTATGDRPWQWAKKDTGQQIAMR